MRRVFAEENAGKGQKPDVGVIGGEGGSEDGRRRYSGRTAYVVELSVAERR